jgi:hypothetical protein
MEDSDLRPAPATAATHSLSPARPARARVALATTLLGLAVALAALALAPSRASAATFPEGFVGVQAWEELNANQLALMSRSKIRTYRMLILWHKVEPNAPVGDCSQRCTHDYDWTFYDDMFRKAALRGVRILPILHGSPRWSGAWKQQVQPTTASGKAAFQQFARAAAERYGPSGTFWRDRPWSPSAPAPPAVRALFWQVWNEPNIKNYWHPRPSATQYGKMLIGVSASLKRASSSVRVVAAGLPWPAEGTRGDVYLDRLLTVPGVMGAVDIFAVHPYAPYVVSPWYGQEDVIDRIAQARNVLVYRGAGDKRLWITEIGWGTGNPDGRFVVTESQQRANLDELYRRVLSLRKRYRLQGAIWFSLKDERSWFNHGNYWGLRSGLFRYGGISDPKPSWRTLRNRALNGY